MGSAIEYNLQSPMISSAMGAHDNLAQATSPLPLVQYFVDQGFSPEVAVHLASKIHSTSPTAQPIANGVRTAYGIGSMSVDDPDALEAWLKSPEGGNIDPGLARTIALNVSANPNNNPYTRVMPRARAFYAKQQAADRMRTNFEGQYYMRPPERLVGSAGRGDPAADVASAAAVSDMNRLTSKFHKLQADSHDSTRGKRQNDE